MIKLFKTLFRVKEKYYLPRKNCKIHKTIWTKKHPKYYGEITILQGFGGTPKVGDISRFLSKNELHYCIIINVNDNCYFDGSSHTYTIEFKTYLHILVDNNSSIPECDKEILCHTNEILKENSLFEKEKINEGYKVIKL